MHGRGREEEEMAIYSCCVLDAGWGRFGVLHSTVAVGISYRPIAVACD